MKWIDVVRRDSQLATLYDEAKNVKDHPEENYFCANEVWYREFKPRLVKLVGWDADKKTPESNRTQPAYEVAYDTIYSALPDCRKCACM